MHPATFVELKKRNSTSDGIEDENSSISICYKNYSIKLNSSLFQKILVYEVLTFILENESKKEEILKQTDAITTSSCFIMDSVLESIKADSQTVAYTVEIDTKKTTPVKYDLGTDVLPIKEEDIEIINEPIEEHESDNNKLLREVDEMIKTEKYCKQTKDTVNLTREIEEKPEENNDFLADDDGVIEINDPSNETVSKLDENLIGTSTEASPCTTRQYIQHKNKTSYQYPPPYPSVPPINNNKTCASIPSAPILTVSAKNGSIQLNWEMRRLPTKTTAKIKFYELYMCQETKAVPVTSIWEKAGDIPAENVLMSCEIQSLQKNYKYHFALRAVDIHGRRAPFSKVEIKL